MRALAVLLLFLLAAGVAVIAYHNAQVVQVNYLAGSLDLPLVVVAGVAFLVGCACATLALVPGYLRQRRQARRLRKAVEDGRAELDNLRKLPLRDH